MMDSSSSSDEEEKAKLKSATWSNFSSVNDSASKKDNKPPQGKRKKSLRDSLDTSDEQTDYRNVDATPEQKAFIAKKLTTWLDSSISVIEKTTTTSTTQEETNDDFQLFSTSKPGLSEETFTPVRQRRRRKSSSDSDSDEERMKLASVAVSYDQILQSSWPPVSKDIQVTSNLLSTNLSTVTSAEHVGQTNKSTFDLITCKEGEKKKKRKKKKSEETDMPVVIGRSQAVERKKVNTSLNNENGTFLESSRPEEQTIKKKKRKKKKDQSGALDEVT